MMSSLGSEFPFIASITEISRRRKTPFAPPQIQTPKRRNHVVISMSIRMCCANQETRATFTKLQFEFNGISLRVAATFYH